MTECNGCGDCCEPVMQISYVGWAKRLLTDGLRSSTKRWMAGQWPIVGNTFADALWVSRLTRIGEPFRSANGVLYQKYRCPELDLDTRRCKVYSTRPPVCRGFPWYGRPPDTGTGLSPRCSFHADLRPNLPIVAVNGKDL